MENFVIKNKISLGQYLAVTIRSLASFIYQDIFTIESFSYLVSVQPTTVFPKTPLSANF